MLYLHLFGNLQVCIWGIGELFTVYNHSRADSTLVSNLFIDRFMTEANDAQLKVYLYLLRCMSAGVSTSVSDMADRFNHTEKDILRALRYWESRGLVVLQFDSARNLTGVCMKTPEASDREAGEASAQETVKTGAGAAAQTPAPHCVISMAPVFAAQTGRASAAASPAALAAAPSAPAAPSVRPGSPSSSPDRSTRSAAARSSALESFRADESRRELLFIIEQYIGKPLAVSEVTTVAYIAEELHFSNDLIDYLFQYCVDIGKKDFRYIEKVAVNWAEKGITTPRQAVEESSRGRRRRSAFAQFRQNQYDFNELSNILDN